MYDTNNSVPKQTFAKQMFKQLEQKQKMLIREFLMDSNQKALDELKKINLKISELNNYFKIFKTY